MDANGNSQDCYKCPKCYEIQPTLHLFDKHIRTHLPDTNFVFQCLTCNKSFKSLSSYFRHEHETNDPDLDMLKSQMPAPLCLMDGEEVHTTIHLNKCNFKCLKCSKYFCQKSKLKRHAVLHCNKKKYKCRYCDEMFRTSQHCCRHMMSHLKMQIEPKLTSQQPTPNMLTVQTLMQNKKENEIIITEVQIEDSKYESHITNAKNEAKNEDELPYECLKCSLKFRYNAWLKKHEAQVHSAERPFKCDICEKSFRRNKALKSHLLIHKEDRIRETCLLCDKKISSERILKEHLRIHTGEKPFNCELCEKPFRSSSSLYKHRKSNHKNGC